MKPERGPPPGLHPIEIDFAPIHLSVTAMPRRGDNEGAARSTPVGTRHARACYAKRSRNAADIRSAVSTTQNTTINSSETSRYWNRFMAVRS